jgi:endonuclease/exonuclease/phosphatase family metal-dependent hydrolase
MATRAGGGDSGGCESRDARLRLYQLNCLAPTLRICKPLNYIPWETRHGAVCDNIESLKPDIVAIQEFDFVQPGFGALYAKRLSDFTPHLKRRTGSKNEGVALFVRNGHFEDVTVHELDLEPAFCARVALVARMRHRASGRRLLVVTSHLTVAHASNGHDIPHCRPLQMQQLLQQVQAAAESGDVVIIAADMNCDHLEAEPPQNSYGYTVADVAKPVHMAFQAGFSSALHSALGPACRPISHTCSYAQDGCADYVLVRGTVSTQRRAHPCTRCDSCTRMTEHPFIVLPPSIHDANN